MTITINVCPKFLKDIKLLKSKFKDSKFGPEEDVTDMDIAAHIDSVPYIRAIKNTIINKLDCGKITDIADKYDRQHYLNTGWTIYKMRYAIDRSGKKDGARIIFCLNNRDPNNTYLLLVYIAPKSECADERDLENEFLGRIKIYIG